MAGLHDFVFLLCLIFSVSSAQRTVDDIFENIDKNYNKNVMPPSRRGQPVMVGITVSLSYNRNKEVSLITSHVELYGVK